MMPRGSETVLLVDDADTILEVGEEILQMLGYNVLVAGSGKEAIAIYENRKETIDLIILDIVMPGMDGAETYDRLQEINRHIKVLLSSGYSVNGKAAEILKRGCAGFIRKPFTIEKLSHKIREVLDT